MTSASGTRLAIVAAMASRSRRLAGRLVARERSAGTPAPRRLHAGQSPGDLATDVLVLLAGEHSAVHDHLAAGRDHVDRPVTDPDVRRRKGEAELGFDDPGDVGVAGGELAQRCSRRDGSLRRRRSCGSATVWSMNSTGVRVVRTSGSYSSSARTICARRWATLPRCCGIEPCPPCPRTTMRQFAYPFSPAWMVYSRRPPVSSISKPPSLMTKSVRTRSG